MTQPPQDPNQPYRQPPQQPYGQQPQQPYGQQPPAQQPYGQPYPDQSGAPFPGQYAQPAGGFQQPPPSPAKKKKWPWVIGGIVAFFVIVAIATGGGDKDKEESAAAPTTTQAAANGASVAAVAPAEAPKETKSSNPGIGEEVRDGKFGFVVTGIETGLTTIGDNPYLQEQAEGQFVLVHVEITNTSDKPQAYFGSNQTLIDTEGREFTNNTMAAINIDAETAIGGDINPGITRKTTIVFDIPTSATPKEIEVHDSMFSGGATISLQ